MADNQNNNENRNKKARFAQFASSFFQLVDNDNGHNSVANTIAIMNLFQSHINNTLQVAAATTALNEDTSDDEDEKVWGGSQPGKAPNKKRDFVGAYEQLKRQYFNGEESVYDEVDFERRFRMPRSVFFEIYNALKNEEPFVQKNSAVGLKLPGIHPLCRFVACLRKLCYGDSDDRQDEYLQISETSLSLSMKAFTRLIIEKFGERYLNRSPTDNEKQHCTGLMETRGFKGAFGAWDCKHFVWKNCPMYLQGQYKGHAEGGKKTTILEAIADQDCYFWYIYFGEPGSLNDLNVLNKSSIVGSILNGTFNTKITPYWINGTRRDWLYFLVDGIYPQWSVFIKPFQAPANDREIAFNAAQEAARKCVERSFGILVSKFLILKYPIRYWDIEDIKNVLYCCIILHNMVVEHQRDINNDHHLHQEVAPAVLADIMNNNNVNRITLFAFEEEHFDPQLTTALGHRVVNMRDNIEAVAEHNRLTADLIMDINGHHNNNNLGN